MAPLLVAPKPEALAAPDCNVLPPACGCTGPAPPPVSGITNLSLNSIDVLSGLDTVKICVAYDLDGKRIDHYPASLEQLKRCKPIYEELPGWQEDITGVRSLDALPENARNYVRRIGELVGVRISTFSVGPGRDQTNILESVWANS